MAADGRAHHEDLGIAVHPPDGRTPEQLPAGAGAAMAERRVAEACGLRIASPATR